MLVTDGAAPLRIARPGHAVLHWRTPRVTVVDTVGAGDSLAAGLLTGLLDVRHHRPRGAGGTARRGTAAPRGRRRAGRRPQLHPGRRRSAHAGGAHRGRARTDDGAGRHRRRRLAELSATAVRARLLDAHDRFWDTDTRALHHPVWFHQFGGFGALARTAGGEDVGYVLGVVTADRLAYLHLLAVRDDRRRAGIGPRLCRWFDDLAVGTGARVVQAVSRPDNAAALASTPRSGRARTCPATMPAPARTASS